MKKQKIILFMIILAAFSVRFLGFWKTSFYIDEAILMSRAKDILTGQEIINPHFVESGIAYGMIISYIHALFMKIAYVFGLYFYHWNSIGDNYVNLKFAARFASILAGTLTVFFVYLSGKKLFNSSVGLFSALILTFSFNHIFISQYGFVDIFFSLSMAIILYLSVIIYLDKGNQYRAYFFTALISAFALSLKYNFPILVPIFIAHFLRTYNLVKNEKRFLINFLLKFWTKSIFIFGIFTLIFYGLLNPYLIINPTNYLYQLKTILLMSWNFPYGAKDLDNIPNIIWYIIHMAKVGLYYPFFIFVLIGIFISLKKDKLKTFLILSYPVAQLFLLEIYTPRSDRYPVWWLPMLVVFGGVFLFEVFKSSSRQYKWLKVIVTILIVITIGRIWWIQYNIIFQKDTRFQAGTFAVSESKPINFVIDIDGLYFKGNNLQVLNSHELSRASLNPQSTSPYNIYRYPGQYVFITDFIYGDYLHIFSNNPKGIIFHSRPNWTENSLKNYMLEVKYVIDFVNSTHSIKTFQRFGFSNGIFDSVRVYGGGTDIGQSYNPTIRVYKIPDITQNIPLIWETYYSRSGAISNMAMLIPGENAKEIQNNNPQKYLMQLARTTSNPAILGTSSSPFPPGDYQVKIYLQINKSITSKKYGYVTFGDMNISDNTSRQDIYGRNIKGDSKDKIVELSFKLSRICLAKVEFTWVDQSLTKIDKIEIIQTE
jgi:4-amino-4-deoxy-L-arabinose transferase-like glycosyltransferase